MKAKTADWIKFSATDAVAKQAVRKAGLPKATIIKDHPWANTKTLKTKDFNKRAGPMSADEEFDYLVECYEHDINLALLNTTAPLQDQLACLGTERKWKKTILKESERKWGLWMGRRTPASGV